MSQSPRPDSATPDRERPETKPFSIRLTENERQKLIMEAGRLPLGTYIRNLLLAGDAKAKKRKHFGNPHLNQQALGRVLAQLGQSRLASNLNQLAKAANLGALPVTAETQGEILGACADVAAMRRDLMCALGLIEKDRP